MSKNRIALRDALNRYYSYGFVAFPVNLTYNPETHKKKLESPIRWKDVKLSRIKSLALLVKQEFNSIAILTGRASNLFVLDIDRNNRHSGTDTLKRYEISIPEDTPCVITPSNGYHYYFRFPEVLETCSTGSKRRQYIDWRGNGGLIFAPPSHPENGNSYQWILPLEQGVLREPPDSLIEWILRQYSTEEGSEHFKPSKTLRDVSKNQLKWFMRTKAECINMPSGKRSEKDFDLLCVGLKIGLSKDALFNEVREISKFAEGGINYFNYTYNKANLAVEKQIGSLVK